MTFAAAVPYALFVLFGAALIVAAWNAKHLVRWENRALTSLADAVREVRVTLEEEQRLLRGGSSAIAAMPPVREAQGDDSDIRAA